MYPFSFSGKKYLCESMFRHADKSNKWQSSMSPIQMLNVTIQKENNDKKDLLVLHCVSKA
jgi:leucine-rich PPR motif-containing protein